MQPELLVQRAQPLTRAERAQLQAAGVSELADLVKQSGQRVRRPDRIAREQQDAVLDRVGHEGPPVFAEDVVAVGAELEERERVGAVGSHEIGGHLARGGACRRARNRQRPEDQVSDHQQRPELEHVDADRDVVVEVDGAGLEAQQVERLGRGSAEGCVSPGPDRHQGGRASDQSHRRHTPDSRAERVRIVSDREGLPAEAQRDGDAPRQDRLLEIEALEQVEQPQREHQHDRGLQGPPAAFGQIRGHDQERGAGRQRQRVEQPDRLDRLE